MITRRDVEMVELVARCRLLTARHIGIVLLKSKHDSRLQKRLTLLQYTRYLDTWPNRLVNQPDIYMLSKKSTAGLALLRDKWGEQQVTRHLTRVANPEHLLDINEFRVRIIRGCQDLDYNLKSWDRSEELDRLFTEQRLIPDAHFETQRIINQDLKTAPFFLELERAAKSLNVIASKLKHYRQLIDSGRYGEIYNTHLRPRVLFVFVPSPAGTSRHRVIASQALAQTLGIRFARFIGLETVKTVAPKELLVGSVWHSLEASAPSPLLL